MSGLNETPDIIQFPVTPYVFIEKVGPFMETAQPAWESVHKNAADISKTGKICGAFSLYKIEPQMIYRAGVRVEEKPANLPAGFQYVQFEGGKYARFVLKGSYSQLPEACGRVFEIVEKTKMAVRDGFYIENYVNDPTTTPEDQLLTEILIPIQ
jgi:DNA gyrase inhibitor GyrI